MRTYLVKVKEVHEGYIMVAASNEHEAYDKADDMLQDSDLTDCGEVVSVESEIIEVEEDYPDEEDDDCD